jgi:Flp pilus assembly protein TadG
VILLLIVNVVNYGGLLYVWISVANAARTGAQYFTTGGATVTGGTPPALSSVSAVVLRDLQTLPNASGAQVCVSTSTSVAVSCNTGTAPGSAPPAADAPEGSPAVTYVTGAVDVTYTYQPIIPLWTLQGVSATLGATAIHRQAKMRVLQ